MLSHVSCTERLTIGTHQQLAEMFKGWYREKKYILTLSGLFVRKDHVGALVLQLFSRLDRERGQWFKSSIICVLFVFFISTALYESMTYWTHILQHASTLITSQKLQRK